MHKILFRGSKEAGKMFCVMALVLTLAFGFAYGVGQQVLRMSANDPQVEILEGISEALNQGQDPKAFASPNPTDLRKSLSPFVIVYDEAGKVVSGTAVLDGQMPSPPSGVFARAKQKGENRVTWEPAKGVRIAAIVKPYSATVGDKTTAGFVLAGRSLREVELRAENLLKLSGIAWAVSLVVAFGTVHLTFCKKEEEHIHSHEHNNDHNHTA